MKGVVTMKCINFDKEFQRYLSQWLREHQKEYKNYDQMEAKMPEVYGEWLEQPVDWLGNIAPGHYFDQFDNAKMLVNHLEDYIKQRVPVPDMLLNRLSEMNSSAEKPLYDLLKKERAPQEARMLAVAVLREIGSELPMDLYIDWVARMQEESEEENGEGCINELAENALESLSSMGEKPVNAMTARLADATDPGKECLCSLLCHYPDPEEKVFVTLMNLLNDHRDRCAVLADFLGKLGNEKALGPLKALAASEETGYLDYIELRNAIEILGDEAPVREFDEKDPAYEALRALEAQKAEEAAHEN